MSTSERLGMLACTAGVLAMQFATGVLYVLGLVLFKVWRLVLRN